MQGLQRLSRPGRLTGSNRRQTAQKLLSVTAALDAPTPQTEANYMVGEVDAKESAVSVSKENLLSGIQVDIKESAHPTAESEGHVDLGEERSRASELTELDGDQEDQVEGDEGVAHSAEQTGPKLKRAWFQIYQEEDVDIHGDTDDVGNKVDEPFLGLLNRRP